MSKAASDHVQARCKPRVLIVENAPRWRNDHKQNMDEWGYQTFVAEGVGLALIDDAKNKARQHRCHVALVDMRLQDDSNYNDTGGLSLVPFLKPAVCIIISSYGDLATVRKALKEKE